MAEEAVATPVGNGAADGKPKKKHKLSFPTAFTILFVITILAVIATWFIPAGAYSKVAYVADSGVFQITEPDGNVRTIEGTAEAFHSDPELAGMEIDVNQFLNGAITKAISVPVPTPSSSLSPWALPTSSPRWSMALSTALTLWSSSWFLVA